MTHPAVLIGIDGGTFDILDPLMTAGQMPHLSDLVARGARAELLSTTPAITPTAWTSLMTGRSPGQHGVMDFVQCEGRGMEITTARHNACETVWSVVSRSGLRAGVLNFPQMHPPRPIHGYSIPGWVTSRWMRMYSYPKGLIRRLRAEMNSDLTELGMLPGEEAKAVEGCAREEYEAWIELHLRRDRVWADVLGHLMRTAPCDLTAVLFDGADRLQHQCWSFLGRAASGEDRSPWRGRIRELSLGYFRQLDRLVGEIAALAGPEANLFLASDHGFGPLAGVLHINAWLESHGYLRWKDRATGSPGSSDKENSADPLHYFTMIDWDRTLAYVPTGSCSGVCLSADLPDGKDRERVLRELRAALLEKCTDPDSGEPLFRSVTPRNQVFSGPRTRCAPDLILEPIDGLLLSVRPSAGLLTRESGAQVKGMHRRAGVFMACGPAIARGQSLPALSILDIAPALLYALGVPIPEDLEGKLTPALFAPGTLSCRPPVVGAATQPPPETWERPADAVQDQEDRREVASRLRALGYID